MKLLPKLLIVLLIATLIPLAVSAFFAIRLSEEEVTRQIRELHLKSAVHLTDYVNRSIEEIADGIRLSLSYLALDRLSDSEKIGALRIIYSQFDPITIVSLLDERGREIVPSVFLEDPASYGGEMARHLPAAADDLRHFSENVPLLLALEGKVSVSSVYTVPGKNVPLISLAIPASDGEGSRKMVLAVELALRDIQRTIGNFSVGSKGLAYLVDRSGRIISHPRFDLVRSRANIESIGISNDLFAKEEIGNFLFAGSDGSRHLGVYSPLTAVQWGVIVDQPSEEAFASVRMLKLQTIFWIGAGLIVAVAISIVFARSLTRPVEGCARGAREIARGNFDYRIAVETRDEVGDLSQSFNYMAGELKKSIQEIERQNEEIRRWNIELQDRVEERTRELKDAQQQLVQAQKMAAVGELGAGIAHELNNPLAGILGFAQLRLTKHQEGDPEFKAYQRIEKEALRCKEIIHNLLVFSQGEAGAGQGLIHLPHLIRDALEVLEGQLSAQGIVIEQEYSEAALEVRGDPTQLKQALIHLITNSQNAMPDGGKLKITARGEGGVVLLKVADTGRGIPAEHLDRIFDPFFTTKENWQSKGMGLALVYRIIENHRGTITVQSEVGKGTTFTLTFPSVVRTQLV